MGKDICKPAQQETICRRVVSYINAFKILFKQFLLYFKSQLSKRTAVPIKPKTLNIQISLASEIISSLYANHVSPRLSRHLAFVEKGCNDC